MARRGMADQAWTGKARTGRAGRGPARQSRHGKARYGSARSGGAGRGRHQIKNMEYSGGVWGSSFVTAPNAIAKLTIPSILAVAFDLSSFRFPAGS